MNEPVHDSDTKAKRSRKLPWWRTRWAAWIGGALLVLTGIALAVIATVAHRAEPILRKRVIETLSARFHTPVELDALHISLAHGLEVSGSGLRILSLSGPAQPGVPPRTTPMLSLRSFQFHTGLPGLLRPATRVVTVYVQGIRLDIPPKQDHGALMPQKKGQPHIAITVDKLICTDTTLILETDKPGKIPLEFNIKDLTLKDVGANRPFQYDATLTNPKPLGNIHSTGTFGPWRGDDPRETPVTGTYSFTHANLGTIKGIGGMLASTGKFSGPLDHLLVDGTTDTPDFSLDTANHPMPLHTDFHAIVDGTTGDTTLAPVHARLGSSSFTASGTAAKVKQGDRNIGHDIALDVQMQGGRIEDMLQLAVKTDPPLMRGVLAMHTKLHIPSGHESVSKKIQLNGNFTIQSAIFSNPKVQERVDAMSERAQGRPQQANAQDASVAFSTMTGNFVLGNALATVTGLRYQLPGALILLGGQYSLNGETFDFHGVVRTQATASQMTTGWKSLLLKAIDPLFKKNGAGLEVPIKISGTKSAPHFGLDFDHNDKGENPWPAQPAQPTSK